MTQLFGLADIHGSGFLDSKELADIAEREPLFRDAALSFFDSDGDGKISRFEFVDAPSPFFAEFDLGRTCEVTAATLDKGPVTSPRSGKSRGAGSGVGQ
jgi:Ca2+-binding EF-hand superfamily protein